ncbi:MAG: hypothetical protein AAFS10_15380 [Myxococcota bacterium]
MSEPIEVLNKRLASIARGRETAKGFHFFCQIGSEVWKGGMTTLQISGTGWVLISHRAQEVSAGDSELYSRYLSTRDLRAFIQVLQKHPFWDLDDARWEPEDDETNIHFRLMDTSQGFAWDTQIWSAERERQSDLHELLKVVDLILHTVSERSIRPVYR